MSTRVTMPTTTGWIRYAFGLVILLIVGGCEPSVGNSQNSESAEIAPVERLDHSALGRPVSAEEIGLWDIDVMPDGEGLPEGSGTVEAGRLLYFERCQGCHGAHGRDGPFDTLAGRLPNDEFPIALGHNDIRLRAPFASLERLAAYGRISGTPLQEIHGTLTPADLHFERHHAGIPAIDPNRHELLIHGMVDRPLKFTLADLLRFPAVTRTCFIECSGNLRINADEETTPQFLCGLTSQREWTGVALSTLLREVGLQPRAKWLLAEGSDAAVLSRSIPIEKALDDAIVAYAQNGEAIRPAQGHPIRLLLPGWEGNTNVKWLRRIEASDRPFMTREETSKYTEPIRGGKVRAFSFTMDARSVITTPTYPSTLERGWHEIRGLAWSGRGRIVKVEVSTDGGRGWQDAHLAGPVLPKAHTRFRLPWQWKGGPAELSSRATDETGYIQPTRRALIDVRGPGALPYHLNPIVSWMVENDGRVIYKAEPWA